MYSLRKYLELKGFGPQFLNKSQSIARIGIEVGHACFEPFSVGSRMVAKKLLVREILQPGTTVRFLGSLKHDVLPNPSLLWCITHPLMGTLWLAISVYAKLRGETLGKDMCQLEGMLSDYQNPPFSVFPFDEVLTVVICHSLHATYKTADGIIWDIPHMALSTVNQIEIGCRETSDENSENT